MTSNNLNHSNKEPVCYNYKKIEDKFFFAAYTNMALSNVKNILDNIAEILNIENKENKFFEHPVITTLLKDDNNIDLKQSSIIKLLDRNLPSSLIGDDDTPKMIGENLKRNIKYLNDYRNFYSHYLPAITSKKIDEILKDKVNEKNTKHYKSLKQLKQKIEETPENELNFKFESVEEKNSKQKNNTEFHDRLTKLRQKAIETSEKRLGIVKENNHKFSKATQEEVPIENINLYSSFVKKFKENKTQMDKDSFLFLLSLFLTKKEMTELLNCSMGIKSTLKPPHRRIRNVFLVLNAKTFQNKLVNSDLKQALSLNIMNDLSRIPYLLKNSLNDEGKENLYITSNKELDANSLSEEEDVYEQQVELVRYGNLFPYQFLQFIELNSLLPKMKFHLHLGKVFTVKPYEKKIGDNDPIIRELTKNLNIHGHLNKSNSYFKDFDKYIIENKSMHENKHTSKYTCNEPLKYYSPKYHFANNRIGICFNEKINNIAITDYKEENGKKVFSHNNEISEYIISQKFLPFLAYWMLKTDNPDDKIKNIFEEFKDGFRNFLKDIINKDISKDDSLKNNWEEFLWEKYNLKPTWIPKKIRWYITGQKNDKKKYALNKINRYIEQAQYFEKGESAKNKEDYKDYEKLKNFSFKRGDKAIEVAKDIVRFMKATEKKINEKTIVEKLSSFEYNILQKTLATCPITEIHQLYKDLNLAKKLPFLEKLIKMHEASDKTTNIQEYFSQYFKASKEYLEELKKRLEKREIDLESEELNFIDFDAFKISYEEIKSYAENLSPEKEVKHPIYIPNDLLKNKIYEINELESPLEEKEEINTTHAIIRGLERDEQQWFYNKKYRKKISDKTLIYRRDSSFRYHWMVDSILWEILKQNTEGTEIGDALKDLSLANYMELKSDEKGDKERTKKNILSLEVEQNFCFKIKKSSEKNTDEATVYVKFKRKLKDLGAYRHMLKNPVVPYILSYYINHYDNEENPLRIETLENELVQYHKCRFQTLKKIFELEEKACNKYPIIYVKHLVKNDCTHIKFGGFMKDVFKDNSDIDDIIEVRNTLLHNKLYTGIKIESNKEGLKTTLVFDKYDRLIENFKRTFFRSWL